MANVAFGTIDHQMDVDEGGGGVHALPQRADDECAHRDRRDEVAVHHVHVHDRRARREDDVHLLAEAGEVSRQDRGRHPRESHSGLSIDAWQCPHW